MSKSSFADNKSYSNFSQKPVKPQHTDSKDETITDKVRVQFVQALENNWVDLDSSEASDFELDAVEALMS